MSSLKKNFSIAQLYSDLSKYEQNVIGVRESRLKKQSGGNSHHQRPSSTHHKNQSQQNNYMSNYATNANTSNFQRMKLQVGRKNGYSSSIKGKFTEPVFEKYKMEEKKFELYAREDNLYKTLENERKGQNLILKKDQQENFKKKIKEYNEQKQNRKSVHSSQFNKNEQLYFLTQCKNLYNLQNRQNLSSLAVEQEANSVKVLLKQINKRDRVYDRVSKILGVENIEEKLVQFFNSYERLRKIVFQFKKMSKLDIDDEKELYQFLINEEDIDKGECLKSKQDVMDDCGK